MEATTHAEVVLDLVQDLVAEANDREQVELEPWAQIYVDPYGLTEVIPRDGGWDLYSQYAKHSWRLGSDGYLYDQGADA